MRDGVRRYNPDLVIAPMLTTAIPADIWSAVPCFIVHPGPRGNRGLSSLDWAIMEGAGRWGVTVLQANAEMDAGDIWAGVEFAMPGCSKSSAYRTEVADAAVAAVLLAVARFAGGRYRPEPLDYARPGVTGRLRPPCRQADHSDVIARFRSQTRTTALPEEPILLRIYRTGGSAATPAESDFHRLLQAADHSRSVARSAGREWFLTSTR
jgi:methionyl-tRNA formyltransferase